MSEITEAQLKPIEHRPVTALHLDAWQAVADEGHFGTAGLTVVLPLIHALRAAREPAGRAAAVVEAAMLVMRFNAPFDNRHLCFFCEHCPHAQGCSWIALADALAAQDTPR